LHHLASGTTRQLTPDTCTYAHASFSPDGTRLLYNCDASGSFEIYTANADGTNPKRLTYFHKLGGTAPVTVYFDKAWRVTKKESYAYYRKGLLDTTRSHFDGQFADYDSTGRLLVDGTYVNGRKNGPCTTYHLNGSKASHGNYLNNVMQGRWEYYYPTGTLKQVVEFGDTDYRIMSFSDSLGNVLVTNGTGAWYDYFGENTQRVLLAGRVVNGQRQGQWTLTGNTGERLLEETFEMGKFVTGTQHAGKQGKKPETSRLGKELFQYPHLELADLLRVDKHFYGLDAIDYILGRDPFKHVDPTLMASFPGGTASFGQFMAKHLGFPGSALYRHTGGKVLVECIVDETGQLTHFRIRQGAAPDLNYEAVRVMKLSPRWIPARLPNGTPQKARVIVPVVFRFDNPKGS
jgi:antitoxin component YwqK of YwqJK toxin-antitoxin module